MHKIVMAALLLALLAGTAWADEESANQIDDTFAKAKAWLSTQKLSVTGGGAARDDGAAFEQDVILFYGEAVGNPEMKSQAQREMMAKRAAVVVAQRSLAEYLNGFALVGDTLVKDGVLQSDSIRSAVQAMISGSQVVFQDYSKEKDTAIAFIKIGLHGPKGFASNVYDKLFKDPEAKKSVTEVEGKPAPVYEPKAEPQPEPPAIPYDGLVIDATDQNFRAALINRVFSVKSELLYDPSKVSQKVLVEQGCGEYVNSVEKGKAALEARGVKNPLVVKAVGTVTASDLQVSDQDAVAIFAAAQKSDFLTGAKVAFVLK
ncbi:hypothetical protein GEOBRER4_n0932 [Citrifermentans bremense]|uniref:Uncharacterized protein n=1 Tax=Citrifermentans bremense TaxID=60035 RepID=A0A6S6LVW3_9BACT|nr:hypothetical protein [Citrifermentans bremense]BCG46147.1 hypothetical protein GEOBRER4_n0932 [Citrifermentans bremense]